MSLETWKREFYKMQAHEVPERHAIDHSLKKWRGLTHENLEKHDVYLAGRSIMDNEYDWMSIDSESCALCEHHLSLRCKNCPLLKILGTPCDKTDDSPYRIF